MGAAQQVAQPKRQAATGGASNVRSARFIVILPAGMAAPQDPTI
jgi:hypothetical protein